MRLRIPSSVFLGAFVTATAAGQSFQFAPGQVPQGAPHNNSFSEDVDFADVDGDGDWDAVFADGGDFGNDRNRIWINQGGLQGGAVGVFQDQTGARLPTGQDASRDVDFADLDADGDPDLYVANTSAITPQSNRWWINQGGLQGGSAGYFVDETLTRWINLGQNNGVTTHSSVSASILLASGGFIDYACDSAFADLDADGDLDLVHSTYGGVGNGKKPTRLFLNVGLWSGTFEEFNPSGFQLPDENIFNGNPGLWCQGHQQASTRKANGTECDIAITTIDVEVGDVDGDFDLDLLLGSRDEEPRLFVSLLDTNGTPIFRDVTGASFSANYASGSGHYAQELGDLDGDGDLDLYGTDWLASGGHDDEVLLWAPGGFVGQGFVQQSSPDSHAADLFDYDGDGDLDVITATFPGREQLFRNNGAGQLTEVTAAELPTDSTRTRDVEVADLDGDGDLDLLVANDVGQANALLLNVAQTADVHAPRVVRVEVAPDRGASGAPTVVRAHVLDNAPAYLTAHAIVTLEYTVSGGPVQVASMTFGGGQVFRGAIPGHHVGLIDYRVRAVDEWGNAGLSTAHSFNATCGVVTSYCTAGTTASGCRASLSAAGTPSRTASSGFVVTATGVEGSKDGLFFYGFNGGQANPWGNGTSFQCVAPPVLRTGLVAGSGTAGGCNGSLSRDLNAHWSTAQPQKVPGLGVLVSLQLWFRDPFNPSNQTTSLSDGLQFVVCP